VSAVYRMKHWYPYDSAGHCGCTAPGCRNQNARAVISPHDNGRWRGDATCEQHAGKRLWAVLTARET
jgi:hypothetical protein